MRPAPLGRTGRLSGIAARLVLLAFAFRCLLPTGFMPDLAALQDGRFTVVICSAHGPITIQVDDAGQPVDNGRSGGSTVATPLDCPFGPGGAQAYVAPGHCLVTLPLPGPGGLAEPPAGALPPEAVRGPPLGARAPPGRGERTAA